MPDDHTDAIVPDADEDVTAEPTPEEPEIEEPTAEESAAEEPTAEESAAEEPEPAASATSAADAVLAEAAGPGGLSWIPYAVYLGLWIVLAATTVYFLRDATPESPARWMPEYAALVWSGVGLAALGPVLSLVVWLVVRSRRLPESRVGLLASAFTRGAVTAFFGALVWLATLYGLEIYAGGTGL